MHRDHQKVGVAREGGFHAIGMMGVEIDIGDPAHALIQQRENAERYVVEIAEAARLPAPAMVGAACGMVNPHGALCRQRKLHRP